MEVRNRTMATFVEFCAQKVVEFLFAGFEFEITGAFMLIYDSTLKVSLLEDIISSI